jgi:hypothetical protein
MNRIAALLLAIAILSLTAAPAQADAGAVCWADADTDPVITQCFASEDALAAAVQEQTGTVLLDEGQSARGLLTTYVLARLYTDSGYGGSALLVTSSNSALCTTGSVSADLTGGWNDVVSSLKSYFSCTTHLYENSGGGGAAVSGVNLSSLGAMNDRASSYRVD